MAFCLNILINQKNFLFKVTSGICTPSNPNLPVDPSLSNCSYTSELATFHEQKSAPKFSAYKLLGETDDLKLVIVFRYRFLLRIRPRSSCSQVP